VKVVKNRYLGNAGMSNLARDVSTLMAVVNTEDKHVDVLPNLQAVHQTSPLVYGIGTMAQGTTNTTRIGDSILVNRIDMNFSFSYGTGTLATQTNEAQTFRWWLVRYLKTPASSGTTAFPISEFLNTDYTTTNYTVNSFPNTDTNENFQIMAEDTIEVILPTVSTVPTTRTVNRLISKSCHFHQSYNGAANTAIVDNMLFLVVVGLNPVNSGGPSGVYLGTRVWFVDN